jgi:hypothetical protein
MDATKAGGLSKGRKASQLTPRELKIRRSNEHAYEHAEVALMLRKFPEPARTVCLRHANIATILAYYTFPNPEKAKAGRKNSQRLFERSTASRYNLLREGP